MIMRGLVRCSVLASAFVLASCGGGLTASQSALVDDSIDEGEVSEDVEVGIEESLSGGAPTNPAVDPAETDPASVARTNAGLFFKPAGCLTSTVNGTTVTHVFVGCTGPWGFSTFDGTVTSTWSTSGGLHVTHKATGFKLNGATVNHDSSVNYTKSGTVYSRTRTGTTSGTTSKGKAFSRSFDHTATWDPAAACVTRDGSVEASLDGRSYSATISDYKRCGVGRLGCPSSGTFTLERTNPAVSLSIDFLGGTQMRITLPGGRTVERSLICDAGLD